jgi:site-specific DNA recombinase
MRIAIYARYSSEHQQERSIDDQVRLCRERACAMGGDVVGIYADYAVSGAHLKSRPEASRLLKEAQESRFDVVISEALDRLSRDQEDVAGLYKRLCFANVKLITLSEGEVDELHVGLKGTMNALFLRDLAAKIKRGQSGRIATGLSAGGLSYGYRVVKKLDERGEPMRGLREIDEVQADVIRRIFREYASGHSARTIAAGLNRDGIPSPFGQHWAASTINGNLKRHSGLLYNEAFVGFLVFNRVAMIKDPETGKRVSRPNPREQWQVVEAAHLRIVSDEIWDAVQARKRIYGGKRTHERRRPRHMFSGLVRCGACGGSYTIKNRDQLACSAHREKGTCDNNRTIRVAELERRVLEGIERRLLAPEAIAEFLREYQAEQRRLRTEASRHRREADQRASALDRQINNIVDAIAEGVATSAMKAKLIELESEKETLSADKAAFAQAGNVVVLHPAAVDAYRKKLTNLQAALTSDEQERREAMDIVRSLVSGIQVVPLEGRGQIELHVCGSLAELLNLPRRQPGQPPSAAMVVAEEGLEPPTQGL